jgi:hypothetical protein
MLEKWTSSCDAGGEEEWKIDQEYDQLEMMAMLGMPPFAKHQLAQGGLPMSLSKVHGFIIRALML